MIVKLSHAKLIVENASRVDAHVAALLLFLAPISLLVLPLPPAVLLIFTAPQIRILRHAFLDYPEFKRNPNSYLVVNEVALALVTALCWALGRLI